MYVMACLDQGVLLLLILLWHNDWTVGQTVSNNRCELKKSVCAACGQIVNVTVVARNVMQPPSFELMVSLRLRQAALLFILEQAAEIVDGFRFRSTYMPVVGYYIDVINRLEGSAENWTFWNLVGHDGRALPCGVSTYIPEDGETILFNFTTYHTAGYIL